MSAPLNSDHDVYCYLKQTLEPACTVTAEPQSGYYAANAFRYRILQQGNLVAELQGDFGSLVPGTLADQARQLVEKLSASTQFQTASASAFAAGFANGIHASQVSAQASEKSELPIASRLVPKRDSRTWFSSGRAAFAFLVAEVVRPRRVFLPTFVCWSLVDVMLQRFPDIELKLYSVDRSLQPELPDSLNTDDAIVDIHYFGHRSKLVRAPIEAAAAAILEDWSHCFIDIEFHDRDCVNQPLASDPILSEHTSRDSTQKKTFRFGSLRKAYRVADGGFANGHFRVAYEPDANQDAWLRLQATDWRDLREAENMLDRRVRIADISSQSLAVILNTETAAAVRQRIANQLFLQQHFSCGQPLIPFADDECPLLHLRWFETSAERDAMRQFLATQQIFTSIHWPVHDHLQRQSDTVNIEAALWIQNHTLAIPVAEDFGRSHMERICRAAREFSSAGASRFPHLHAG